MPNLWDSGGPSLPPPGGPERDGPGRGDPERTPAQAPQIDWNATGLDRAAAEPIAFGFGGAYGPAWQRAYGTLAGRTLTGATPDEAFPAAATPDGQKMRDTLAQILAPDQPGADHPDVQAVLRGALTNGMSQTDRAVVNRAALAAAIERDPEALIDTRSVPREHLEAWDELAQRPLSREVRNEMDAMNAQTRQAFRESGQAGWVGASDLWSGQPVRDAIGGTVNMDYYAVRVDRMPPGKTPADLLSDIRTANFRGFVDANESTFHPY